MRSIGIIGLGVVGNAVKEGFKHAFNVKTYDISVNCPVEFPNLLDSEIIFLCLPTPTIKEGSGLYGYKQDLGAITSTLEKLGQFKYGGIVVIKSTTLPGTTKAYHEKFKGLRLVHNPEFLTARTAAEDFRNQKLVVIGAENFEYTRIVSKIYLEAGYRNCCIVTSSEAEMVKYICNVFFASKVSIFNELSEACKLIGADYNLCKNIAQSATGWFTLGHTMVPGPDGKVGWGGACYPKDIKAFIGLMDGLCPTIVGALRSNVSRRGEECL